MVGNQEEMSTTTKPAASYEYAEPYGQIITQGAGAEYAYAYVSGECSVAKEEDVGRGGSGDGPQQEGWEQNIIYAPAAGTDGESMGGHDGGGMNSAAATEEGWADNSIYNSGDDDEGGDNAKIEEGWKNNIIYE